MKERIIIFIAAIFMLAQSFVFCAGKKEDESFFIANKAFSDGFYDASLSLFQRFIKEFPKSQKIIEAKLYIAKSYYFKEDYKAAIEILREIIQEKEAAGNIDETFYWLAQAYYNNKDFLNSLIFCQKIIDKYSPSQDACRASYLAAKNYQQLSKDAQAQELLIKAIEQCKEPNIIEQSYADLLTYYFQKKDYTRLRDMAEKYLKFYPKGLSLAKAYFYLGESAYANSDFGRAMNCYRRAIEGNSDTKLTDLILGGLAFSLLELNQDEEAKKYIAAIKDEESQLYFRAVYSLKTKDYTRALEDFGDFIIKFPKAKFIMNAYLSKADALYGMGRINDALSDYLSILNNFKDLAQAEVLDKAHYGLAWCYLKNAEYKKAIEEFKNTLKFTDNPVVKLSSEIQIADTYQEAGNYSQALEIYSEILKNNPDTIYSDYIQFQTGMAFLRAKKFQESSLALKKLQKSFPSSKLIPQAQYYLAVGYFSMDSYQQAEKLLEDLVEKFKSSGILNRAYYLLGKCFYNEKKYAQALEIFKATMEKFNDKEIEELILIDVGNCYFNLSQFDNAKETWEDFLSKFNKSQYAGSAALHLGHLYFLQNSLDKAQAYLEVAAKSSGPLRLKAKLYLAKIYAQKGQKNEAIKMYDELINAEPQISSIALFDKGCLLKEDGRYSQAIDLYQRALAAGLESVVLRFSLATCLEKVNQNKAALDEYFKVIHAFSSPRENTGADSEYELKAYFRIAKIYEKDKKITLAKEIYGKIAQFDSEEAKIARAKLKELAGE